MDPARGMAVLAGTVAVASAAAPRPFLALFGVPGREVTGATAFGVRLFSVRTGYLAARAWQREPAALAAFLPVQLLDQAVFWHAGRTGAIPRRGAALASATSGALIALDLARRRS